MSDTVAQFEKVISICRDLFSRKLEDYGASWRIMRPSSLTDQIYIIALIQLELGYADRVDITNEKALELYDKYMTVTKNLMYAKNHDYDEAWRGMRPSSYTDLILMKICRTKQIENHEGVTQVSEGVDANYMDMINYSLFGLIKIEYGE